MSVAHTAPDIYPHFAGIKQVSAKAKKPRGGELILPRARTKHRKIEIADSFVDALFSDFSHLEQSGLDIQNDCGAAFLSNGHEFTLPGSEDIEIADGGLDFSAPANDNVAIAKTRASVPVALVSLLCHAAIAGILLFAGFNVTQPSIENGEAVAITIVGDTVEKSSVAAASPEPLTPITGVAPAAPIQALQEPAPIVPTAEPTPVKQEPVLVAVPTATILTSETPAATSVHVAAPLPAKPKQQVEPAKAPALSPAAAANPVKKVAPIAKPLPPVKKPVKAKAAEKPTEARAKPVKKINKKAPIKNAGTANNEKAKNAGKGAADQKQGSRDGAEKGVAAQKSAGAKSGAAGNADASNYAGLVQRKISRTRQRPVSGGGQAVVSFMVSPSGAATGISIASSSGNPGVDAAALDHIRRSSPFPAPPAGAQTRFQIPIRIN